MGGNSFEYDALSRQLDEHRRVRLRITTFDEVVVIDSTPGLAAQNLALLLECPGPAGALLTVGFLNMRNYVAVTGDRRAVGALSVIDKLYPDGVGLQVARRMVRLRSFRRVSGTDTVPLLLAQLPPSTRVFLIGGSPDLSAALEKSFPALFPQIELVGCRHGFLTECDDLDVAMAIRAAQPDVVLLGMGTPLQEIWLQRNRHQLQARLVICVGGLFHYWAGDLRRAPPMVQRIGMEWLWILVQQPKKWRVYSLDALHFIMRVVRLNLFRTK